MRQDSYSPHKRPPIFSAAFVDRMLLFQETFDSGYTAIFSSQTVFDPGESL
ncbi:hypothetical protein CHCC20335_1307 [Bacillus paralicheniformis]|nr:hypothetical protein CHCC20335_1307 [Bacillus paralicheniformis]